MAKQFDDERRDRDGHTSVAKYAAAWQDLRDEKATRAFLERLWHPETVRALTDNMKKWVALQSAERNSVGGDWAFEFPGGIRGPGIQRAKQIDPAMRKRLKSFITRARALLTETRRLQELLDRIENSFPPYEPLAERPDGETPAEMSDRFRRHHLEVLTKRFTHAASISAPPQLAMGGGPLPSLAEAVENAIRVFTRDELPPTTRPPRPTFGAFVRDHDWLEAAPGLSGKTLTALECLATGVFLGVQRSAARRCKTWDTTWYDARRELGLPVSKRNRTGRAR